MKDPDDLETFLADPDGPTVLPAHDPDALQAAVEALWAGGIVGIPTDTVYGLAVLPLAEPLRAVMEAKRRPGEKGIALLIDDLDQAERLALVPVAAARLAARFWPGPLTVALPIRPDVVLPEELTGGRQTIGVRVPDHPVPRALARELGPLAVTSANISGQPEARTASQLVAAVGASLALVLDGGPVAGGSASTVVGLAADGSLTLFREGPISQGDLEAALA